jgi:hypothetical protein
MKSKKYQNLWDTSKAILRGKFIAINGYIKKKPETSQINNLLMHLRFIEKQEERKPQINRWREIKRSGKKVMKLKPNKLY